MYDEMFDEIGDSSAKASNILSTIAKQGYNSGSFQITQVILDRVKDLFAFSNESRKKGNATKPSQSNKEETADLINQLKG